MNISDLTLHNILDTTSNAYHYHIPNYQREYTWKKENWEALLDDLLENPVGHFMGSIISLKQDTGHQCDQIYDIVDGQQRLTTISLMLMAIYEKYLSFQVEGSLDRKLILNIDKLEMYLIRIKENPQPAETSYILDENEKKFLRVKPTSQNSNLDDYVYLLYEVGIIKDEPQYPLHLGNRRIKKAFRYFQKNLPKDRKSLEDLLNRIQNLYFILITADDPSMAYRMFETLNNRGVPLTPVDIIKNQVLSKLASPEKGQLNDEYAFNKWKVLIKHLPENVQIRFFRQYYNVYQFEKKIIEEEETYPLHTKGLKKATQSNLTLAFKSAINENPNELLELLIKRAKIYFDLIRPYGSKRFNKKILRLLEDLDRVGAATAYASLMLITEFDLLSEDDFEMLIDLNIKYYLRRSLTDTPPTRDLDTIQRDLCEKIFSKMYAQEEINFEWLKTQLFEGSGEPASLNELKSALNKDIYDSNLDSTRFILIKIEETKHTREYKPNLWERNDKRKYLWTIEHILPQDEDIKPGWVNLIADGNIEKARDIWYQHRHRIGNLSLSGYNSRLSNSSLKTKQEKKTINVYGQKINIGYKNGLYLNNIEYEIEGQSFQLSSTSEWNEKHIDARSQKLIDIALSLFRFDESEKLKNTE